MGLKVSLMLAWGKQKKGDGDRQTVDQKTSLPFSTRATENSCLMSAQQTSTSPTSGYGPKTSHKRGRRKSISLGERGGS